MFPVSYVSVADRAGRRPRRGPRLVGMRDRLATLGGRLSVDSSPGAGTLLVAEIPLGADS